MTEAFICDGIRTPIGRFAGALSGVRPDDLGAAPLRALRERNPRADWDALDDVVFGCGNQAGEDSRNVARMSLLLAGLPYTIGAVTVNRLCGSGLEAVAAAARMIRCGEADMVIAGGVESMSRGPYVLSKAASPFARNVEFYDTTLGWRFVNPDMKRLYGTDSMGETAENVAQQCSILRVDQDAFAYRSQQRAKAAQENGALAAEIVPVQVMSNRKEPALIERDEHPRKTSLEALAALPALFRAGGTVTAGNSSGINDGACALLLASESAAARHGLTPRARVAGAAVAGVEPRVMGLGPIPATRKLLTRLKVNLASIDLIELNEAFAAQALAVMRELGLADDAPHVNPLGGAIALGHPIGASGARLATTALWQLLRSGMRTALCTMCIGVGQGIAVALERVG